ncbi:TIGR03086 family metal-binding protein [Streptomyces sp. NPDC055036]
MNDTISKLLGVAADRTVTVVRNITDDQLTAPTPCAQYDVHALVDHLFQVIVNFKALAAKKDSDFGVAPEHLTGAWRDRFADETARLIEAWAEPGAEEGTTGSMALPARTVGAMVVGDMAVHGWDLARATGQPYEPDAALVGMLGAEFGALAPTARKMGMFGEPVPVGEDAGPFETLLAMTGRDPGWGRP